MPSPTKPPVGARIPPLVPALVAVVVTGLLVALVARSGGDDAEDAGGAAPTTTAAPDPTTTLPPAPSTTALPEAVPIDPFLDALVAADEPTAYTVTYDVVENGLARTEEWLVRRPYESLVTSSRDGVLLSGTATSRTALRTFLSDRGGWLPLQPELHRAAFDLRIASSLGPLSVLGRVEQVGEASYLDRPCLVFRTGQPPSAGAPTAPSDAERAEVCVDSTGIVLHERWEIDGATVIERTATALALDPRIDAAVFDPAEIEDAEELGRAFGTIAVPADAETLAALRVEVPVPAGYAEDGAVFRASADSQGGIASAETVRFLSSGPDLLEVAELATDPGVGIGAEHGVRVAVEGWDEVWLVPDFRVSALRARTGEDSYLELRHHDVGFLVEVLRSARLR